MNYEISMSVDTYDFGQSEWSESIMVQTKSLEESNPSEVAQLKAQMVIDGWIFLRLDNYSSL